MNGTSLNVGLLFFYFPYLPVQSALGDGADARMSRSFHIYGKNETVSIRQLSVRFLHCIVEIGRMSHVHAGRFN